MKKMIIRILTACLVLVAAIVLCPNVSAAKSKTIKESGTYTRPAGYGNKYVVKIKKFKKKDAMGACGRITVYKKTGKKKKLCLSTGYYKDGKYRRKFSGEATRVTMWFGKSRLKIIQYGPNIAGFRLTGSYFR